jgi:hypothetical protein
VCSEAEEIFWIETRELGVFGFEIDREADRACERMPLAGLSVCSTKKRGGCVASGVISSHLFAFFA